MRKGVSSKIEKKEGLTKIVFSFGVPVEDQIWNQNKSMSLEIYPIEGGYKTHLVNQRGKILTVRYSQEEDVDKICKRAKDMINRYYRRKKRTIPKEFLDELYSS